MYLNINLNPISSNAQCHHFEGVFDLLYKLRIKSLFHFKFT